jgi:drug/metabolite transporter (DMT)-like permease
MVVFLLLATAFAQVAFKDFHHSRRRASLLVAIGLFAACPLLTILASRQLGIGKVYVFMSLAYGLVAYLGWKRFGERVTRAQLQGIALITLGCILYAF